MYIVVGIFSRNVFADRYIPVLIIKIPLNILYIVRWVLVLSSIVVFALERTIQTKI